MAALTAAVTPVFENSTRRDSPTWRCVAPLPSPPHHSVAGQTCACRNLLTSMKLIMERNVDAPLGGRVLVRFRVAGRSDALSLVTPMRTPSWNRYLVPWWKVYPPPSAVGAAAFLVRCRHPGSGTATARPAPRSRPIPLPPHVALPESILLRTTNADVRNRRRRAFVIVWLMAMSSIELLGLGQEGFSQPAALGLRIV